MRTSTGSIKRPIVLIVLVILIALFGAIASGIGSYIIVAGLRVASGPMGQLGALLGLFVFVPGVIELALAYGLWKLKLWALWLGVVVHVLGATLVVQGIFRTETSVQSLVIAVGLLAIVAFLLTPQVRHALRPDVHSSST